MEKQEEINLIESEIQMREREQKLNSIKNMDLNELKKALKELQLGSQ